MKKIVKLHIAAKSVVDQLGVDVIQTDKFANLLMDYHAFEEYPATKQILRDVLKKGYGQRLYDELSTSSDTITIASVSLMNEYSQNSEFKQDMISYVFDCLLYSIGAISEVNDPFSNAYNPFASKGNILDTLDEQYNNLKKQYVDLLEKLAVKPVDLLHDAAGYYTTESLTMLYAIEAKLVVLGVELGKSKQDWCRDQLAEKKSKMQREKIDAVKAEITKEQTAYTTLATSSVVVPKFATVKFSGYFDSSKESELKEIEDRIVAGYKEIGLQYDNWCKSEKDAILKKYEVGAATLLGQIAIKILTPIMIVFFSCLYLVRYVSSKSEIEEFNRYIAVGDSLSAANDPLAAFDMYYTADTAYTGSFLPSRYHANASEAFESTIIKFDRQFVDLMEDKKLSAAKALVDTLPNLYCSRYKTLAESRNKHRKDLEEASKTGLNQMIKKVSSGNGKLKEEDKEYLDELIAISNDSYWLNVIKKKSK